MGVLPPGRSAERGPSLRLDALSRSDLDDGSIAQLVRDHRITGIATDACDFVAALTAGSSYDAQFAQFAQQAIAAAEAIAWARTDDVRHACDLLAPLHEAAAGSEGHVSVAVDPRCAYDTEGTLHAARRLRSVVGRDNVHVGVPATAEGVSAIQELISEGINVDATSVYGLEAVRQVVAAYLAGLEQAAGRGGELSRISAMLSIRVAEMDDEVGRLATGSAAAPLEPETVAAALAGSAVELLEQTSSGDFWRGLRARGARPLRLVWDTTVEDDRDRAATRWVERLTTPGAVLAVSSATLGRLVDDGSPFAAAADSASRLASRPAGGGFETIQRRGIQLELIANRLVDKRIRRLTTAHAEAVRLADAKLSSGDASMSCRGAAGDV